MNLKLEEIKLNRNEFHRSSQQIYLNQVYVLFYLRLMDLLSILKTTKKHVIFGLLWWCNFEIQQNLEKNKKLLSVQFDSQSIYDEKYIKIRANIFEDKVITKFTDNEIPK